MDTSDKKTILVDVLTGLVLLLVLVFGYLTFVSKETSSAPGVTEVNTTPDVVAETIAISDSIAQTKEEIGDLARAVTEATQIFNSPDFVSLEDFSRVVPAETVGRDNPFLKTDWKLRLEALEQAAQKAASQTTASQTQTQTEPVNVSSDEEVMDEVFGI